MVPYQVRRLLQLRWCQPSPDRKTQLDKRTEDGDYSSSIFLRDINHRVLNICLFPPLFFFSVLYYTDVLSASCVLATYIVFLQRRQKIDAPREAQGVVHESNDPASWFQACFRAGYFAQKPWLIDIELCALGLYALLFRQTNIFWVAIFLAGLEIIRVVKPNGTTSWEGEDTSFSGLIRGGWYHGMIYDPLVREACIEGKLPLHLHRSSCLTQSSTADYLKTAISLTVGTAANLNVVLAFLIPYIFLLTAFGGFVLWNGGVVLGKRMNALPSQTLANPFQGHKEFHTVSIHLPQMLYIWPNFMFFSFPLIYPYLLNSVVPQSLLPSFLRFGSIRHRLPRPIVSIVALGLMSLTVHYNTIVHPFTLADNRHYVFYIFRILLRHPSIKYLAVPVYFLCAWGAIQALGGISDRDGNASPVSPNQTPSKAKSTGNKHNAKRQTTSPKPTHPRNPEDQSNRTSFVLIYLLTTTFSLITAPLVEPRYFIIPWLIWRVHVPVVHRSPLTPPAKSAKTSPHNVRIAPATATMDSPRLWLDNIRDVAYRKHDHRLWLETLWVLLVNAATCYLFLYWGFEWPSEEERGRVQRFMW